MARVSNEVLKRYQDKAYRKYTIRIRNDGSDGITPAQLESAASAAFPSVNAYVISKLTSTGGSQAVSLNNALLQAGIDAEAPAEAQGETIEQFLKRAVENQEKRDKLARML